MHDGGPTEAAQIATVSHAGRTAISAHTAAHEWMVKQNEKNI